MILKINMANNINKLLNLRNSNKKILKKQNKINELPIVTIPIIAYIESKTTQNNLGKKLLNEALDKSKNNTASSPITNRTDQNIKALKEAGLNEREAKKYINANGYIDKQGKEICKNKNVTSFKGAPNNENSGIEDNNMDSSDHFADIDNSDIDNIPGLHEDLTELNSVGIDMSPELQEIYDAPPIESAQELIEQLLGDLADSVNIDWDFESIIDTMLDEITDIGDWL